MKPFVRHTLILFVALRAGDLVNLAAGLWLVPKFVAPNELGAVLPITSFVTFLALPLFAFGMAVTKEGADLAARNRRGEMKALWRGTFAAVAGLTAFALLLAALCLPAYARRLDLSGSTAAFFALAAALLGAVTPVCTDALQSVKRFGALALVELASSVTRFLALAALMPVWTLCGYFGGNLFQPLARLGAAVLAWTGLKGVPLRPFWTPASTASIGFNTLRIFLYLALALGVSNLEVDLVRHTLSATDSAAYFVLTRFSDVLNYLTAPLLCVLFPYAATAAHEKDGARPLVFGCMGATLAVATVLALVYVFAGRHLVALVPHGADYAAAAPLLPLLVATTALTACPTFHMNAEVAAGRFRFLRWFAPFQLVYAAVLATAPTFLPRLATPSLGTLLTLFFFGAAARCLFICPTGRD